MLGKDALFLIYPQILQISANLIFIGRPCVLVEANG